MQQDFFSRFQGLARPARNAPEPQPLESGSDPKKFLEVIQKRYRWAKQAKEPYLASWATCLAFYVGEHYRKWHRSARKLVQPTAIPSWRVQLTENQIPGIVEAVAAKLARSRQMPRAKPNTGDEEDRQGALAGTRVLEHWWKTHGMDWKELQGNIHRIIFGNVFYHDYWDPTWLARVPVVDPRTGSQTAVQSPVGDVEVELLSVFDVFPEPQENFEEIRWCLVGKRMPIQWFEETFGAAGKKVKPETMDLEGVFDALMPVAFSQDIRTGGAPIGEGSAVLKIYYERPCPQYPRGRHAMYAVDELLYRADQLPLGHLEIPVTISQYRYVPKRLWAAGLVETVIGQQRELNKGESYLSESLRLHGRPQRLAPRGLKTDPTGWSTSPDAILEYDSQYGEPKYLNPPNLPTWVDQWGENKKRAIFQLAGQGQVSANQIPPGVTAGSAIRLVQEQDDTRLRVPAMLGAMALQRVAKHVLQTAVERYREPRLISTLGRGGQEEVTALLGSEIGQRDVVVSVTEGVAETGAMKTEMFFSWNSAGVFDKVFSGVYPPSFLEEILSAIDEQWLADALRVGLEEQQQRQAQAAEQQAMAGEQQQAQAAEQQQAAGEQQVAAEELKARSAAEQQMAKLQEKAQDQDAQLAMREQQFDGQALMEALKAALRRREERAGARGRPPTI